MSIFTLNCVPVGADQNSYSIEIEIDPTAIVVESGLPTPSVVGDLNIPRFTQGEGEFDANISKFFIDPETGTGVKDLHANIGDNITVYITGVFNVTNNDLCAPNETRIVIVDRYPGALLGFPENIGFYGVQAGDYVYFMWAINFTVVGCGEGVNQALIEARCIDEGGNITDRIVLAADDATVTVPCRAAALTPTGLVALVGLLSALAVLTMRRKRR